MSPRAAAWLVAAVATVAGALWVLLPGERATWVSGGALVLLSVSGAAAVTAAWRARRAPASPFDALTPSAPAPARPDDLVRLERMLGWKAYSPSEFGANVAPVLGRILGARVRERFGVDPATEPERARALVSRELWPLVDRSQVDASGPTVTTRDIARLVDLIEAL